MADLFTSAEGVDFIKGFEGFRPRAYMDVAGVPTIGYGHTTDENFAVKRRSVISVEEATELLALDLGDAEEAVRALVTVDLTQYEFDALVSFAFNLGSGNLGVSSLLKLLNSGDRSGAAAQFVRWHFAGGKPIKGLLRRRVAERNLFLGGSYVQ